MTEREIFLAVLDLPDAADRSHYLDRVCGGDTALRARIESLLLSHDTAGSFLGNPAVNPQEPSCAGTLELENATPPEGANGAGDLKFLDKPGRPDSLGRIGHYEVLEVLGRGGFGIVFRALDETLQRVVAVKVLAEHIATTSPARKRFLREARSSAKVRHENIVQVYAVEEQPLPYLVMEFIPGETLQQRLDRTGPLETVEAVQFGRQIAEGLAAAHGMGLIHRDIKPANILIEAGPHACVKITDFGLARAADDASMTQSGTVAGTPLFMAPEQAQGETLDHRADLFSLGSVLYTMCSGRPPFRANNTLAVLKRVVEDTPRPIPEIIPEVPQWLCDIITRLHAKKPEDRIATAQEVADLLARGLAEMQRPGNVPPAPSPSPLPPKGRGKSEGAVGKAAPAIGPRFRTRRWVAAAAVLLLLVGGLGFTEATGVTNVTNLRGTVIRLFSPEGTLVVEVDDPGVSIKIDGSDIVITGAGVKEIRLKPGSYTVEASKNGKVVRRELITVTKNGRQVVRVSQEKEVIGQTEDPDRRAAEWVLSIGGGVQVNDQDHGPKNATELPRAPFRLTGVGLQSNKQVSDAGLANFKGCKNLMSLTLGHMPVSDAGLANFKDCKNLTHLALFGTQVSDVGLAYFKDCKNLKTLWLAHTQHVHGAGVAHFKNLTGLWLNESGVNDAGLAHIKNCKNLTFLTLHRSGQVSDAGLVHVKECKNLTELELQETKVTAKGIDQLKKTLPKCKIHWDGGVIEPTASLDPDRRAAEYVLSIGGRIRINEEDGDRNAAGLPREAFRLTWVNLVGNPKVSNVGLAAFKDCKNLTYLNLDGTQVGDAGLAHFKDCKNLTYLQLGHTPVSDAGLAAFKDCKNLTYLNLDGTQVSDAGLAHFKDCKNLRVLWAMGTRVGDTGVAHLKGCENLTELLLNGSPVTDAWLVHLKDCKNLTHLELKNTLNTMKVSDTGLAHLKDCKNLTNLGLYGNNVTAAGIDELRKALPKCKIDTSTP